MTGWRTPWRSSAEVPEQDLTWHKLDIPHGALETLCSKPPAGVKHSVREARPSRGGENESGCVWAGPEAQHPWPGLCPAQGLGTVALHEKEVGEITGRVKITSIGLGSWWLRFLLLVFSEAGFGVCNKNGV